MNKALATLSIDRSNTQVDLADFLMGQNQIEQEFTIIVAAAVSVTLIMTRPLCFVPSIVLRLEPGATVGWLWYQTFAGSDFFDRTIHIIAARDASCTMHMLSTVVAGELHDTINVSVEDFRALVDIRSARVVMGDGRATLDAHHKHNAEHTVSSIKVRDILFGAAQAIFRGRVVIAEKATGSDGLQDHKALLLSDQARCKAIPEIQVCTDQISCAHGSAIGRLSEEQLSYLQSRGLDTKYAQQLLLQAFIAELEPAGVSVVVSNAYCDYMQGVRYE